MYAPDALDPAKLSALNESQQTKGPYLMYGSFFVVFFRRALFIMFFSFSSGFHGRKKSGAAAVITDRGGAGLLYKA
ncbi:MAG: hypothetical protein IK087_06775 [Lachnospiraceae bacterium]|nr:hypothetical protein [Lachnospiraceae bacterium]